MKFMERMQTDSSAYSAQTDCTAPCSGNVGERTLTSSSYSQAIDFERTGKDTTGLAGENQGISYRFDVTDIVQEIVCRGAISIQPCVGDFNGSGAWVSGNDFSILFKSVESTNVDNWINIFSYDDTQGLLEPTLQINCWGYVARSLSLRKVIGVTWARPEGDGSNDCNNNWLNRKKVTFDNRASGIALQNFPALIRLDSTKIDYSKVQMRVRTCASWMPRVVQFFATT